MENQTNDTAHTEVDLSEVKQKIKGYYTRANDSFFDGVIFIKKYIIIITLLLVAGIGLGIFLDQGSKLYVHKVFVTPNFGSTDFMYEQVERLEAKIKERDTSYIYGLGIKDPKKIAKVEIDPVVDIYDFMDENKPDQQNNKIDLFKIIAENGEMEKTLEDKTTSRNYKNHLIQFTTTKKYAEKDLIAPLLKALNSDPYWVKVQKESLQSLDIKTAENAIMIAQLNKVLSEYGNMQGNTSGVALRTDNTNLADMFNLKNMFIREQARNRLDRIDYQYVVKDRGTVLNVYTPGIVTGHAKFFLPLLFMFLFLVIIKFRNYYRAQLIKRNLK